MFHVKHFWNYSKLHPNKAGAKIAHATHALSFEPHGLVLARGADVCQLLAFKDIDLEVVAAGVFAGKISSRILKTLL